MDRVLFSVINVVYFLAHLRYLRIQNNRLAYSYELAFEGGQKQVNEGFLLAVLFLSLNFAVFLTGLDLTL